MKRFCSIILLNLTLSASAHNPAEAFFSLIFQGDSLIVKGEIPYSLRAAVLASDSTLQDPISKKQWQSAVYRYLHSSLYISTSQSRIKASNLGMLPQDGHAHQSRYQWIFILNKQEEYRFNNYILHNIYPQAVNFHQLKRGEQEPLKYETDSKNSSFILQRAEKDFPSQFWYIFAAVILLFIVSTVLYRYYRFS